MTLKDFYDFLVMIHFRNAAFGESITNQNNLSGFRRGRSLICCL